MTETEPLAVLAFICLLGLAAETAFLIMRGPPKRIFAIWDPAVGPAGTFLLKKVRHGARYVPHRDADGRGYLFPLLPGYGAGWGKEGRGTIWFGNIANAVPTRLANETPADLDELLVPVIHDAKSDERPKDAEKPLLLAQTFRFNHEPKLIDPNATNMSDALEDIREAKAARAQNEADRDHLRQKGAGFSWAKLLLPLALIGGFFLVVYFQRNGGIG